MPWQLHYWQVLTNILPSFYGHTNALFGAPSERFHYSAALFNICRSYNVMVSVRYLSFLVNTSTWCKSIHMHCHVCSAQWWHLCKPSNHPCCLLKYFYGKGSCFATKLKSFWLSDVQLNGIFRKLRKEGILVVAVVQISDGRKHACFVFPSLKQSSFKTHRLLFAKSDCTQIETRHTNKVKFEITLKTVTAGSTSLVITTSCLRQLVSRGEAYLFEVA